MTPRRRRRTRQERRYESGGGILRAIVYGALVFFALALTYWVMAKPTWNILEATNSTLGDQLNSTSAGWSSWLRTLRWGRRMYGTSAIMLFIGVIIYILLWATKRQYTSERYYQ